MQSGASLKTGSSTARRRTERLSIGDVRAEPIVVSRHFASLKTDMMLNNLLCL